MGAAWYAGPWWIHREHKFDSRIDGGCSAVCISRSTAKVPSQHSNSPPLRWHN